jgi:hypothetical protein
MKGVLALLVSGLLATSVGCDSDDGDGEGGTVEGTGYSFELPEGWASGDVDDEAVAEAAGLSGAGGATYDAVAGAPRDEGEDGPTVTVLVLAETPPNLTLPRFAALARETLGAPGPDGSTPVELIERPSPLERTRVAGEAAVEFGAETSVGGSELRQRFVLTARGPATLAISFGAPTDSFDTNEPAFEEILSSWRWG